MIVIGPLTEIEYATRLCASSGEWAVWVAAGRAQQGDCPFCKGAETLCTFCEIGHAYSGLEPVEREWATLTLETFGFESFPVALAVVERRRARCTRN